MNDPFASVAGPGAEGTRKNSRWLAAATARLSDFITMAVVPPRAHALRSFWNHRKSVTQYVGSLMKMQQNVFGSNVEVSQETLTVRTPWF